jgi:hypothetical protein
MSDNIIQPSSFYYESDFIDKDTFFNYIYSLDIEIEEYFSKMLFYSDLGKIIYASNEFSFRKRVEQSEDAILNIPFMNYFLKSITPDTNRQWWKNTNNVQTMMNLNGYKEKLGFGVKLVPVHLNYEATIWFSQDKDLQYAYSKVLFSNTNETILYPKLTSESGFVLKNLAIMSYNLDFKPEYTENEWLEMNNITSATLDFEFDTLMVYPDTDILLTPQPHNRGLFLTEEIIFDFLSKKNITLTDTPENMIRTYFTN